MEAVQRSVGGLSNILYIRRLEPFLLFQNLEFQYLFVFSVKMNIFGRMKILWIFLGGNHKAERF